MLPRFLMIAPAVVCTLGLTPPRETAQCFPAPTITTGARLFTTSEAYGSWTIDPSRNRLFFNVNFSDPRLIYLASQLSGGVIRFGKFVCERKSVMVEQWRCFP